MSERNEFNPDWQLSPKDSIAVTLSIALAKHIPGWPGATDEELAAVADAIGSSKVLQAHVDALSAAQAEIARLRVECANLKAQWADFPTEDGGLSIDTASAASRLREMAGFNSDEHARELLDIAEMLDVAGPTVQALRSDTARLKEALEPYANEPLSSEPKFHRTRIWSLEDQDAYIRRARSALSGKQSDG